MQCLVHQTFRKHARPVFIMGKFETYVISPIWIINSENAHLGVTQKTNNAGSPAWNCTEAQDTTCSCLQHPSLFVALIAGTSIWPRTNPELYGDRTDNKSVLRTWAKENPNNLGTHRCTATTNKHRKFLHTKEEWNLLLTGQYRKEGEEVRLFSALGLTI